MTKTALVTLALKDLGVLDVRSSSPGAAVLSVALDGYSSVYNEFLQDGLVSWAEADEIPAWAVSHMKAAVAAEIAGANGIPTSVADVAGVKAMVKRGLSAGLSPDYVSTPTTVDHF